MPSSWTKTSPSRTPPLPLSVSAYLTPPLRSPVLASTLADNTTSTRSTRTSPRTRPSPWSSSVALAWARSLPLPSPSFSSPRPYRFSPSPSPCITLLQSAFMCNWAAQYRDSHPSALVIAHYIGSSALSTDLGRLLQRVLHEIKQFYQIEREVPQVIPFFHSPSPSFHPLLPLFSILSPPSPSHSPSRSSRTSSMPSPSG